MAKIENKFLLEDYFELAVANFYTYDKKSGLEVYSGSLESHELSQKGDTEKIKGGRNNEVLGIINKDKELSLKIVDLKSKADMDSLKFGGAVKPVGSNIVYGMHMPKNYTIVSSSSALKITLDKTPVDGEDVVIYNNKTKKMIQSTKAVRTGKDITITEAGLVAGDTVYVTGFRFALSQTDSYSEISTTTATPNLYVVIEVPLFDEDMQQVCLKQYHFPKTTLSTSVTKTGKSDKSKNTEETTLDIQRDRTVDYLGRIVYIYPEA